MKAPKVVNEQDKQWGIIAAAVSLVLTAVFLLLVSFQFADPPPRDIPLTADLPIDELVMEELRVEAGGAGGGTPSDDPIADPTPQVTNVITTTESKVSVKTGNSNKTNTNKQTNNTATTTQQSTNPFGGGSGDGSGGGDGDKFGSDSGKEGNGVGTSSGAGRTRYNEISTDNIYTAVEVIVKLQLKINAEGQVVYAVSSSGTTTTDQRIINQVIAAAKAQLKYSKEPNAGLQIVFYSVKVVPH